MRNLDLAEETKENEATLSQDDSTDTEGREESMQRGKTSHVSRKSNLNALTGNPSKLGKKQQLSILLSLIHDIRLVYYAALKVPRKHINVPDGADDPEPLIKIFDEEFISRYTPEQRGPRIVGSWAIAAEDVIKHRGAVHKKFANSIAGRYQARRFAFGTAWRWA